MDEEEKKDPKEELSRKFREERGKYSLEIRSGVELLYNIRNIKDIQVKFLSLRQRLLEDNHKLLEHLRSANKKLRERRSVEWEKISKSLAERYQAQEKKVLVEGKISITQDTVDMISDQISFYAESIKTVDNVLYGLKTRLEVEKLLG